MNSDTPNNLTQRQLINQARQSCESLLLKTATAIERLNNEPAKISRRLILIAIIRKTVDSSRAIALLSEDVSYYENTYILVRCLIESVINGAYLQSASDDEVKTYQTFDVIPLGKVMRYVNEVSPSAFAQHISGQRMAAFEAQVDKVKQEPGKTGSDFGWTKVDVVSRSLKVDKELGVDAFILLARIMFPIGHAFVHGNHRSLERLLPMSVGGQSFEDGMTQALYMNVLALSALAAFANISYKLGLDDPLATIAASLQTYTNRLLAAVGQSMKNRPY